MPLRSVLDIEVNDQELKGLLDKVAKYRDQIEKMPGVWKNIGSAVKGTAVDMEGVAALLFTQNEHLAKLLSGHRAFNQAASESTRHVGVLSRLTSNIARDIHAATSNLLRWGTISSAALGVLGFGGLLLGADRLAATATSGRQQAFGLGLPYGTPGAFEAAYGPLLQNPRGVLQGVLTAKSDISSDQYRAMMLLGIDPDTQDPGEVVSKVAAWARRTPRRLLGPLSTAFGIGSLGFSPNDLVGFQERPFSEVGEAAGRERRLKNEAKVQDDLLKKWQDLDVTLAASRLKIQSALIEGLAPLAPELVALNTAFADAVKTFLKSEVFKGALDFAIVALHRFTDAIEVINGLVNWPKGPEPTDRTRKRWEELHPGQHFPGDEGLLPFHLPTWKDVLPGWITGSSGSGDSKKNIDEAVNQLRSKGFSDAAITGVLAAGMGEGGFATSWRKSNVDPASFGPWQLNFQGGEGVLYNRWLTKHPGEDPKAVSTQAEFLAERLGPGFAKITDPLTATHVIEKYFERHKGELGLYDRNIGRAAAEMAKRTANPMVGGGTRVIVENRTGGSAQVSTSVLSQVQ